MTKYTVTFACSSYANVVVEAKDKHEARQLADAAQLKPEDFSTPDYWNTEIVGCEEVE